jgi:surface antigen
MISFALNYGSRLMKKHWMRTAALVVGVTLAGLAAATPSEARSHVSIGLNLGGGGYYGGPYWGPRYGYGPYWGPSYYWSAPVYAPYAYPYGYDYRTDASYAPPTYYAPPYAASINAGVALDLFPAPLGDAVDARTRDIYFGAYRQAMAAPVGNTVTWNDGGASGGITTVRDGWAGQRYCREFRQTISLSGRSQEATGTACREPNGSWELVPNQH